MCKWARENDEVHRTICSMLCLLFYPLENVTWPAVYQLGAFLAIRKVDLTIDQKY